jgi:hypothetical protein
VQVAYKANKVSQFKVWPASGRLLPMQSLRIVTTFSPQTLGQHQACIVLSINNGAGDVQIHLFGTCNKVGQAAGPGGGGGSKNSITGGKSAQPQDFMTTFSFKEPEEFLAQMQCADWKTLRGPNPEVPAWVKVPPPLADGSNPDICSISELEAKAQHKFRYAEYLVQQHKLHFEQDIMRENGPEFQLGRELGMRNVMGLKPPLLELPAADEPLYLKPEKEMEPRKRMINPDRLLNKKFAAMPSSEKEASECSSALTAREMNLVTVYPDVIDFGVISPDVKVSKSFAVSNDNTFSISVSLKCKSGSEAVTIYPATQVIRSRCTAGFDINVLTDTLQEIRTLVMYQINSLHAFNLCVNARPVPVNVTLQPLIKQFTIPPSSMNLSIVETVALVNNSVNNVEFRWQRGSGVFTFPFSEGLLAGNAMQDVSIRYTPGAKAESEETIVLKLVGGEDILLKCFGCVEPASLRVVPKTTKMLDFGTVLAGLENSALVTLNNPLRTNAAFAIDFSDTKTDFPGLSLKAYPEKGLLAPGDSVVVVLTLHSKSTTVISAKTFMTVAVRGGRAIKLGVNADIRLPEIEVVTDEVKFGHVYVGSSERQVLQLRNNSAILDAVLVIDLRKYPEFSMIFPEGIIATPMPPSAIRPSTGGTVSPASDGTSSMSMDVIKTDSTYAWFNVPANTSQTLLIEFAPKSVSSYAFELPLLVKGMSSLDLPLQLRSKLRRVVAAQSSTPRVQLSILTANFAQQVNVSPHLIAKNFSYAKSIQITNFIDISPVKCILALVSADEDTRVGKPCLGGHFQVFEPSPKGSVLVGGGSNLTLILPAATARTFQLGFCPSGTDLQTYRARLQIFLDEDPCMQTPIGANPYLNIEVVGMGSNAAVFFDRREVMLPLVPLNTIATTTFYLLNHGYDNLYLKYRMPDGLGFSVTFPEGQVLSIAKHRLPVEVKFISKRPCAVTAVLSLIDPHGQEYKIEVSGVSDNSYFGVHSFFQLNADNIQFDGSSVRYADSDIKPDYIQLLRDGGCEILQNVDNVPWVAESIIVANVNDLDLTVQWASAVLFPKSVESLKAIIQSQGQIFLEMFASLGKAKKQASDKKKGEMVNILSETPTESEIKELLAQYEDLLDNIKMNGGLLSNVSAANMLPYRAFRSLYFEDAQSKGPYSLQGFYEAYFDVLQRASWASVLYQVVRILALNRVTQKFYETIVSEASKSPSSYLHRFGSNTEEMRTDKALESVRSGRSVANTSKGSIGFNAGDQASEGGESGKARTSEKSDVITGSNAYSIPEMLLLKWLTTHHNCVRKESLPKESPVFLRNFTAGLRDSCAFASAIISHVPSKKNMLDQIKSIEPSSLDSAGAQMRLKNAKVLLRTLQDLQWPFLPPPEAIAEGNGRVLVLLAFTLMDLCPKLLPRDTVQFNGVLNTNVVRQIQLNNPLSKSITYLVRIEGSTEFACDQKYVVLSSKASAPVSITHKAKFSVASSGTLLLLPSEPQDHIPPLAFQLSSTIVSNQASALVISFTAQLYEISTIEVPVTHPFEVDKCNFHVTLLERAFGSKRIVLL